MNLVLKEKPVGLPEQAGASADEPAWVFDAAAGSIVSANDAGWQAWGLDASTVAPPLAVDRAMPALQRLCRMAGHGPRGASLEEVLTFWTARGIVRLPCRVQPTGDPAGATYAVRAPAAAGLAAAPAVLFAMDDPAVTLPTMLAHELRTPLSAVIVYAEILKDEHFGPHANPRYRDYAKDIHATARHALQVIDGMLQADPDGPGVPPLALADLDLAAVVESCLAVARPLAEGAGLELGAELAPHLPRVVADEVSLKQMLLNLLANAIKFARRGDRIQVVAASQADGALSICVADTGPGMEHTLANLPAGSSSRAKRPAPNAGLGLGLPLTRTLAEANGATITIESTPGQGTRVTISFGKDRVVPI